MKITDKLLEEVIQNPSLCFCNEGVIGLAVELQTERRRSEAMALAFGIARAANAYLLKSRMAAGEVETYLYLTNWENAVISALAPQEVRDTTELMQRVAAKNKAKATVMGLVQ